MAKIVWIASYPRSGNTWVRFQLANLLYGRVPSSAALNKAIPDIHRKFSGGQLYGNRKLLIKTHWCYRPDMPLREDTIGAIYILRHPIDVLVSNLDYQMVRSARLRTLGDSSERQEIARRWIDEYIAVGGDPSFEQLGIGGWNENIASWTGSPLPYPRLVLRYEDLKADPTAGLAKMAGFLGFPADPARLAEAVELSSFSAMRALEEQEIRARAPGIFYSPMIEAGISEGHRFVRRGEAGGQEDALSPDQRRAALQRFGAVMARFGYADRPAQAAPAVEASSADSGR